MTVRRAMLIAAAAALITYAPSLANRFALDDTPIIESNPNAHSIAAAIRAFDQAYWPPQHMAGLWRPLVILSFATEWQLTHGNPVVMHATNVVAHAAATALLVPVLAAYTTPAGALAGALIFAVHPVHVEAVANLVGRAEMFVAVALFAALLLARAARRRLAAGGSIAACEAAILGLVVIALLCKEHAVVAAPLLFLDELALRRPGDPRLPARTWIGMVLLTVAWYLVHRRVESGLAFVATAPTFFQLSAVGRVSTMLPVIFVVARLLVWPFDLSIDYQPEVVPRLTGPTLLGVAGAIFALALLTLALLAWKKHRAVATGLLLIALAWAPTSNFAFATGIVLSERTLYLASAGLALLVAAAWEAASAWNSRAAVLVTAGAMAVLAARSVVQIPVWRSTRDLVVSALLTHPESYRVHQATARVFMKMNQRQAALREYRMGAALYELDPYLETEAAGAAMEENRPWEALQFLRMSMRHDSTYTVTLHLLSSALLAVGQPDQALIYARRAVRSGPTAWEPARALAMAFLVLGQPDSALAVWPAFSQRGGRAYERWLLTSTTYAALGQRDSAQAAFERARALLPDDTLSHRHLTEAARILAAMPVR